MNRKKAFLLVSICMAVIIAEAVRIGHLQRLVTDLEGTLAERSADAERRKGHVEVSNALSSGVLLREASQPATPTQIQTPVVFDRSALKANPGFLRYHKRQVEREVQRTFGDILSSFALTPEQRQKLNDLLTDRALAVEDARDASRAQTPRSPELEAKAESAATAALDNEIANLVGAGQSDKLQSVFGVLPELNAVKTTIGADLGYAGVPLTTDQEIALAAMMKNNGYSPVPDAAGILMGKSNAGANSDGFKTTMDQAAVILRPEQFQVFQAAAQDKLAQEEVLAKQIQNMPLGNPK